MIEIQIKIIKHKDQLHSYIPKYLCYLRRRLIITQGQTVQRLSILIIADNQPIDCTTFVWKSYLCMHKKMDLCLQLSSHVHIYKGEGGGTNLSNHVLMDKQTSGYLYNILVTLPKQLKTFSNFHKNCETIGPAISEILQTYINNKT